MRLSHPIDRPIPTWFVPVDWPSHSQEQLIAVLIDAPPTDTAPNWLGYTKREKAEVAASILARPIHQTLPNSRKVPFFSGLEYGISKVPATPNEEGGVLG